LDIFVKLGLIVFGFIILDDVVPWRQWFLMLVDDVAEVFVKAGSVFVVFWGYVVGLQVC
jgi:hypothetical protein